MQPDSHYQDVSTEVGNFVDSLITTQNDTNVRTEKEGKNGGKLKRFRLSVYHHDNVFQSKTLKTTFACSLGLNFIFFCALIGVVVVCAFSDSSAVSLKMNSLKHVVCYHCGKEGIPGVRVQVRADNGFCCVKKDDEDFRVIGQRHLIPKMSAMMGAYSPPIDCDEENKGNTTRESVQIAARLVLDTDFMKQKNARSLKWMTNSSTGFIQGAIDFVNDSILCVKEGGLINVKSHFSFDSFNKKLVNRARIIKHAVFKLSARKYSKLAYENVSLREREYQSSDLEVTVRASANECFGVYVSTLSAIYDLPVANIFQVVKIGS